MLFDAWNKMWENVEFSHSKKKSRKEEKKSRIKQMCDVVVFAAHQPTSFLTPLSLSFMFLIYSQCYSIFSNT